MKQTIISRLILAAAVSAVVSIGSGCSSQEEPVVQFPSTFGYYIAFVDGGHIVRHVADDGSFIEMKGDGSVLERCGPYGLTNRYGDVTIQAVFKEERDVICGYPVRTYTIVSAEK